MKTWLSRGALALLLLFASNALAGPPKYSDDPFGDNDFRAAPLILDTAYPTRGRAEMALMFSSSTIDKYNSHIGAMAEVDYQLLDTLGLVLDFGWMHGSLTPIVTDAEGIIGNKVKTCQSNGGSVCNLQPDVPDFRQITGLVSAGAMWSPLYGKINVVSELDVNLQIYVLAALGANGTREVNVEPDLGTRTGYRLHNGNLGDGGLFGDLKIHGNVGLGVKVFMANWMELRAEVRDIFFWDQFDFTPNNASTEKDSYRSDHYFAQVGLGFLLF